MGSGEARMQISIHMWDCRMQGENISYLATEPGPEMLTPKMLIQTYVPNKSSQFSLICNYGNTIPKFTNWSEISFIDSAWVTNDV